MIYENNWLDFLFIIIIALVMTPDTFTNPNSSLEIPSISNNSLAMADP